MFLELRLNQSYIFGKFGSDDRIAVRMGLPVLNWKHVCAGVVPKEPSQNMKGKSIPGQSELFATISYVYVESL